MCLAKYCNKNFQSNTLCSCATFFATDFIHKMFSENSRIWHTLEPDNLENFIPLATLSLHESPSQTLVQYKC